MVIGFEEDDFIGSKTILPIIYYNIDKQLCSTNRGEFCIIGRKCETIEEIINFVYCINFLFHKDININKK